MSQSISSSIIQTPNQSSHEVSNGAAPNPNMSQEQQFQQLYDLIRDFRNEVLGVGPTGQPTLSEQITAINQRVTSLDQTVKALVQRVTSLEDQ